MKDISYAILKLFQIITKHTQFKFINDQMS